MISAVSLGFAPPNLVGNLAGADVNSAEYAGASFVGEIVADLVLSAATGGCSTAAKAVRATIKGAEAINEARQHIDTLRTLSEEGVGAALQDIAMNQAANALGGRLGGNCFVAGTLVVTCEGLVPIEQIEVGDLVLSRCDRTGAQGYQPVITVFPSVGINLLEVDAGSTAEDSTPLTVTANHPFWVEGRGWRNASALQVGDTLSTAAGGLLELERIEGTSATEVAVYNFEVATWHTYFVASGSECARIWVHNTGKKGAGGDCRGASGGEPPQLARGKRAHKEEPVLPGERAEVPTPSGKRMDRYNEETGHIREIKPDNPRAIRQGEKQVEGYRREMEEAAGRPHTGEVTPYDPKKYE